MSQVADPGNVTDANGAAGSAGSSGGGSGLEAGVTQLGKHGCTLNSCFLRPRSRGTVRLASAA